MRTMFTLTALLTAVSACSGGRGERPDDEAAESGAAQATTSAAARMDLPADLVARAKVSSDAARTTALARVPGGQVQSGELEEEDGMLIYSFDIGVQGREGIEEIHVDAMTGEVVAQEHESPAMEKAEADTGGLV